jgi:hypothetical protein
MDLVSKADQMMYRAKQGKNAVASPDTTAGEVGLPELSQSAKEWMHDSKKRGETAARERISADNTMVHFSHGTWSIGYVISGNPPKIELKQLLETLPVMPGQTRCLHPWRVPSPVEKKPYPFEGLLECWPAATADGFSPEFWRASPDLKLFYLRKYEEDEHDEDSQGGAVGSQIEVRIPIWRAGECVLHAARLSAALSLSSGLVTFRIQWTGLRGRQLTSSSSMVLDQVHQCRQDSVESETTVTVVEIETKLPELVKILLTPLYTTFAFYDVSEEFLKTELSEMLKKCAGT